MSFCGLYYEERGLYLLPFLSKPTIFVDLSFFPTFHHLVLLYLLLFAQSLYFALEWYGQWCKKCTLSFCQRTNKGGDWWPFFSIKMQKAFEIKLFFNMVSRKICTYYPKVIKKLKQLPCEQFLQGFEISSSFFRVKSWAKNVKNGTKYVCDQNCFK